MKKTRIIIGLLPILLLMLVPFQGQSILQGEKPRMVINSISVYVERGPIEILNDSAFASYGFEGSGTPSEPYLIDGFNITSNTDTLIDIRNTRKHLKIKNNFLDGIDKSDYAIRMSNVTHGTLVNNTISRSYGVFVENSYNNTYIKNSITECYEEYIWFFSNSNNSIITDNVVNNSYCAASIAFDHSHNSVVSGNTLNNDAYYGIYLDYSTNITLTGNTITNCSGAGIQVFEGQKNIITDNAIYNCSEQGIQISDSDYNTLSGNDVFNCTLEGIYVDTLSMFNALTDNIIYNCDQGIFLVDSHNNTLLENVIHDIADYGIAIFEGDNNTISRNTVYNCEFGIPIASPDLYYNILTGNIVYNCIYGIYIGWSHNTTASGNTVYSCTYGFYIEYAHNNTISYNIVHNSTEYGLVFDGLCENNTVILNNFVDNNVGYPAMEQLQSQALDNGISDEIFSNYWSDWSGIGHYPIDQTMNGFSHLNNDSSPLAGPVLPTLSIITPVVLDYDTDTISVMFSGSPTIMQYSYYIEGVDNQNKTWTTSVDRTLLDGTYTLNAYGSDIAGNTVHESVSFTIDAIVDTTTTTTPETTTSEITTETTTTSKTSSFPALASILVFFGLLSIVIRKRKKI